MHPLGPDPIPHLGGSSLPKIKFLQHPSSLHPPRTPNPEKSPAMHNARKIHGLTGMPHYRDVRIPHMDSITFDTGASTAAETLCGKGDTGTLAPQDLPCDTGRDSPKSLTTSAHTSRHAVGRVLTLG